MNPDHDLQFDYAAQLTLHAIIAGLEAQIAYYRDECVRLNEDNDSLLETNDRDNELGSGLTREQQSRIVALEQELDELSAAKAELDARWEQRLSDQHDRHSAELAKYSRQLADARITAARAAHDLQAMRAERDDLRHQLDANNTGNNLTLPGTTKPDHVPAGAE